jgi:drug/metabolite transporter (DMT)-like permease
MKKKNLLLIFTTALISGISIFMNKFAVRGIESSVFTFSKNVVVALFLFSLIVLTTKFKEFKLLKRKDWLKLVLIGLVGGSIPFILFFKGLQLTTGANASLIHKSMFVFVSLLAILFLKEKLNKKWFIAAGLLLVGNYLMLRPSWSFNLGDLMILTATLFWAVENTLSKHTLKDLSGNVVAWGRMFFGSLFIFGYLIITDKTNLILALTSAQLTWILITSSFLFLYVFTWYNGLKHVSVSLATSILLLGSPITTLLKFFTGTALTIYHISGMLMVLLGVLVFFISTNIDLKEFLWKTKH